MVIDTFRQSFPEFADEAKYTDEMITFWSEMGTSFMNATRWGSLLTYGLYLFVAHQITLSAIDVAAADSGRTPGLTAGVISNKSVGGVSVSYDVNSTTLQDAGNYNMTKYGREFWKLMRIVGTGGAQV